MPPGNIIGNMLSVSECRAFEFGLSLWSVSGELRKQLESSRKLATSATHTLQLNELHQLNYLINRGANAAIALWRKKTHFDKQLRRILVHTLQQTLRRVVTCWVSVQ